MRAAKRAAYAVVFTGSLSPIAAMATEFDFNFIDQDFSAVLNQTLVAGVAFRIEPQDARLIGKSNINPNVCSGVYQLCQGLNREQIYPAQQLRRSPGAASMNFDDGNLNFNQGDVTQSPIVWTHDLKIESGDFGFFYRGRAIYDPALYHGKARYRNRITAENAASVGISGPVRSSPSNRYFPQVLVRARRSAKRATRTKASRSVSATSSSTPTSSARSRCRASATCSSASAARPCSGASRRWRS